jgi:Ca2+-binding EF-hand superfamily protein
MDTEAFKMLFLWIDRDGDGKVTLDDMKETWGKCFGATDDAIAGMMDTEVLDESGFVAMMKKLEPKTSLKGVLDALEVFEYQPGVLKLNAFTKTMKVMGERPLTQGECEEFIRVTDVNGTGTLDYKDVVPWLMSTDGCVTNKNDAP